MLPELNRSAVIITPTQTFFNHLAEKTNNEADKAVPSDHFDAATIYLVPHDLDDEESFWSYLETVYLQILEEEVEGWVISEQNWTGDVSFETFKTWFNINFQSMIFDTVSERLHYE